MIMTLYDRIVIVIFGSKSAKNTNSVVYPFAKDRREKINELQAMTFDDGPATDAQRVTAPPKSRVL